MKEIKEEKKVFVECSCCGGDASYYPHAEDAKDVLCLECSFRGCYLPGRLPCNFMRTYDLKEENENDIN